MNSGAPERNQNDNTGLPPFTLVFGFIYWLNHHAVRKDLEPRRKELQTLLASLNESGEASSH